MTIGAISTDSAVTSSASTVGARSVSGDLAFSEVLRSRGPLSSGSADLDAIFEAAGQRFNLSPNLLKAVAKVESNFRPNVTSRQGAMGIMQLMPYNAGWPAVVKHGGIPPFKETQNYVPNVLGHFNGGDITAGTVTFDRIGRDNGSGGSESRGSAGAPALTEALTQMLLIKMIEMQMNSSNR
jgi:hypothetical protein